jgi:hypothetical protein
MDLSKLSKIAWLRANILLKSLFPEYAYIKVNRHGVVRFKKKRFTFWSKDNLYRMLQSDIPFRLQQNINDWQNSIYVKNRFKEINQHIIFDTTDIINDLYEGYLNAQHISIVIPKKQTYRRAYNRKVRYLFKSPESLAAANAVSMMPVILITRHLHKIL